MTYLRNNPRLMAEGETVMHVFITDTKP